MCRNTLIPVVLTGGRGSRLAPLSTPLCPKPFIPFPDGSSLLQHTLARLTDVRFRAPVCVGNAMHRFLIANHARMVQVEPEVNLLEQESANTGFAIAATAAWFMQQERGEEVLAILPADHAIARCDHWYASVDKAATIARDTDSLVLLGIEPSEDSSAYGYIGSDDAGKVTGFAEKPEHAAALCMAGWVWNSGQVIVRAKVLAQACEQHAPHLWRAAQRSVASAQMQEQHYLLGAPGLVPEQCMPFDKAVLEKAANLQMVRCDAGWQDVGTPEAFCAYAGIESHLHDRTDHPWGYSEPLAGSHGHIEKRLTLYPACRISLQRHSERDEHWNILEGTARITLNEEIIECREGDTVLIPRGIWHRLENAGEGLLRVHEVQSGVPDENDIERIADDYGRA